jgi:hypothetical protein
MKITKSQIVKLQTLVAKLEKSVEVKNINWLDKYNASQALLICIGAGPWRIERRTLIQKQAVDILGDRDLSEANTNETFNYPLLWQRQKIAAIIAHLKRNNLTMDAYIKSIIDHEPIKQLYQITNTKTRAKVLDLYGRDYLKVISFPIDRWVKRVLEENKFLVNEGYMIELCKAAGLEAGKTNRLFVGSEGFSGNATNLEL